MLFDMMILLFVFEFKTILIGYLPALSLSVNGTSMLIGQLAGIEPVCEWYRHADWTVTWH